MSYFELIDEFHVTDFSMRRQLFGKSFTWKGVRWSTMVDTGTTTGIGLFLGFETSAPLPDDFYEAVEYMYSLLTMDNVFKNSGM
jgi:hypothetical protein